MQNHKNMYTYAYGHRFDLPAYEGTASGRVSTRRLFKCEDECSRNRNSRHRREVQQLEPPNRSPPTHQTLRLAPNIGEAFCSAQKGPVSLATASPLPWTPSPFPTCLRPFSLAPCRSLSSGGTLGLFSWLAGRQWQGEAFSYIRTLWHTLQGSRNVVPSLALLRGFHPFSLDPEPNGGRQLRE